MVFFITFTCYGCHLPGHESGSVSRSHNRFGSRLLEPDSKLLSAAGRLMDQPPYRLDRTRRQTVLTALQERCAAWDWNLLAAHVRSNHVHLVLATEAQPERAMNDLKAYASRCLNRLGLDPPLRKRWARHGSTRWLFEREDISAAIRYVVEEQGEPMAVFVAAHSGLS